MFDKFNNILISDSSGQIGQIYTNEGQLIHNIESNGPTGIAVTQDLLLVLIVWIIKLICIRILFYYCLFAC